MARSRTTTTKLFRSRIVPIRYFILKRSIIAISPLTTMDLPVNWFAIFTWWRASFRLRSTSFPRHPSFLLFFVWKCISRYSAIRLQSRIWFPFCLFLRGLPLLPFDFLTAILKNKPLRRYGRDVGFRFLPKHDDFSSLALRPLRSLRKNIKTFPQDDNRKNIHETAISCACNNPGVFCLP